MNITVPFAAPSGADAAALTAAGVRYCAASYVDMHGVSKAKMVPISHHAQMLSGSELFTGAAMDGVPQSVHDDEVAAVPDPASCLILPWKPEIAWFASDLRYHDQPFDACSRNILKRQLFRAARHGLHFNLGIEAEFFVFRSLEDGDFSPLSSRQNLAKPCYDFARLLDNFAWADELVSAMNTLGWDVYSFDHEDGIGQFEIDFMYTDALTMADRYTFFRFMAHEIARKHGGFASFMPKPFADRAGSGAHFNMSLADRATGANCFADVNDRRGCKLGALGYQFIAGVLKHLPAICAVVAPSVNSYKRLVKQGSASGFTWAPVLCCYGNNNRTNALRIPLGGGRVELRAADSACNPYLGTAMVLAAGLEGIENDLDPGIPNSDNMYMKTDVDLDALGIKTLPNSLSDALDAFAVDPLGTEVFGPAMFGAWLDYKRNEWASYAHHVSDWEYNRYLRFF
ncbi:MAG: type III glutamate--ammonia ligase [Acidiphilium sp.]|nr:type III glutamate--ammonia ligase [Acidiphilium sp.]MDD4936935.1 type III glutamate--ammonia ligase [Acidiphilium sp.]